MKAITAETEPLQQQQDLEVFFPTCYPLGNILSGLARETEGHTSRRPNQEDSVSLINSSLTVAGT